MSEPSPLMTALLEHRVSAKVTDCENYRIRGGLAVETDYIITLAQPADKTSQEVFETFAVSKTYSAFRTLAQQLKEAADKYTGSSSAENLPKAAVRTAKGCELVSHLIESQPTSYLGKTNYMYVKTTTKQRSQILNDALETIVNYFPDSSLKGHALLREFAVLIETFFLTDHCDLKEPKHGSKRRIKDTPLKWLGMQQQPSSKSTDGKKDLTVNTAAANRNRRTSIVVPISRRNRRSDEQLAQDEEELIKSGSKDDRKTTFLLPNSVPTTTGVARKLGIWIEKNPMVFMAIAAASIGVLRAAGSSVVRVDGDMALLAIFASFCLGMHTPRPVVTGPEEPSATKATVRQDRSGRMLLRRSMAASTPQQRRSTMAGAAATVAAMEDILEEDEEDEATMLVGGSPLPRFPEGAKIGSVNNCWSDPGAADYTVRGPNYLQDKKKAPSGDFLFPCRGLDLFLTDTCPEHVGSNGGCFGGRLREAPTLIINFRLPWGVLLLYGEIPERFIPFLKACYEKDFDKSTLPNLEKMSAGERAACRFLMGDEAHKNETLKIVPVIVDGPWVVKQVVGGKPSIIGLKVPTNYVYQPAEGDKALYLELDLDVAASSVARKIVSIARSYTQVLTLNLGFVVQGNTKDELPEQMMVGARLHGIDPLTAPTLPPMPDLFLETAGNSEDEDTPVPASE